MPEGLEDALNLVKSEDAASWFNFGGGRLTALLIFFGLAVAIVMMRRIRRFFRRREPPRIHPKLQKYGEQYGVVDEEVAAKRRAEAEHIIATSSTGDIAGYDLVEQVEAVFVDGFRRPEEAIEGLKAAAAMKGANGVTNVNHDRNASGRCSASGDAVIIRKHLPAVAPPSEPPSLPAVSGDGTADQPSGDTPTTAA